MRGDVEVNQKTTLIRKKLTFTLTGQHFSYLRAQAWNHMRWGVSHTGMPPR
jgi:hypothetical protein